MTPRNACAIEQSKSTYTFKKMSLLSHFLPFRIWSSWWRRRGGQCGEGDDDCDGEGNRDGKDEYKSIGDREQDGEPRFLPSASAIRTFQRNVCKTTLQIDQDAPYFNMREWERTVHKTLTRSIDWQFLIDDAVEEMGGDDRARKMQETDTYELCAKLCGAILEEVMDAVQPVCFGTSEQFLCEWRRDNGDPVIQLLLHCEAAHRRCSRNVATKSERVGGRERSR